MSEQAATLLGRGRTEHTFRGGAAVGGGSGTCTQSSEWQSGAGGGEVAGVPEGVPFPPAQRQAQNAQSLGPPAALPLSWRPVPVRKAAGAQCGAPGQSHFRVPLHVPEAPEVCIGVNTRFTAASPQTQSDLRLFLVLSGRAPPPTKPPRHIPGAPKALL